MNWKERFWSWLADRLPRQLVYHALIRAWVFATTGKYSDVEAGGVRMYTAIQCWEKGE